MIKILMAFILGIFFVGLVSGVWHFFPSTASDTIKTSREKRNGTKTLRGGKRDPTSLRSSFPHFGSAIFNTKQYKALGGGRFEEWKDGDTPYFITPEIIQASDELARERRQAIKAAMNHAWSGYRKWAFGYDELQPVSGKGNMRWSGVGTTLVDSLDTLWIMGMKEEFYEGRDWVRDHLSHDVDGYVSFFENTIRSLGGLLSAYDWSGDEAFLDKATDLGDRLVKAFDSPSGVPYFQVNLKTGKAINEHWSPKETQISAAGSVQMEFRYLTKVTGNKSYAEKAEHAFDVLSTLKPPDGLYYTAVRNMDKQPSFGNAGSRITFGGRADSFYEYMLKLWLQGGKTETKYREMYDESIEGMHKVLLKYSTPSGLAYLAKRSRSSKTLIHEFEHLECFMGGTCSMRISMNVIERLVPNALVNSNSHSRCTLRRIVGLGSTYRSTWSRFTTCTAGHENSKSNNVHLLSNVSGHRRTSCTCAFLCLRIQYSLMFSSFSRYAITPTGLGPEIAYDFISIDKLKGGEGHKAHDFKPKGDASHYLLRPEGELIFLELIDDTEY